MLKFQVHAGNMLCGLLCVSQEGANHYFFPASPAADIIQTTNGKPLAKVASYKKLSLTKIKG